MFIKLRPGNVKLQCKDCTKISCLKYGHLEYMFVKIDASCTYFVKIIGQ